MTFVTAQPDSENQDEKLCKVFIKQQYKDLKAILEEILTEFREAFENATDLEEVSLIAKDIVKTQRKLPSAS